MSVRLAQLTRRRSKEEIKKGVDANSKESEPQLSPFIASLFHWLKGEISVRIIYVVGRQRSGKTTMVKAIVSELQRTHKDKVFFMITNDSSDIYKNFRPSKPYNVFFVDDAGSLQCSYEQRGKEAIEKFKQQKIIAHLAEAAGFKEGCITIFYGAQNDTLIGFQLRSDAEISMIKSLNLNKKEDRELLAGLKGLDDFWREFIDQWIMKSRALEKIQIGEEEIDARSLSLVIFPNRKWAWFKFDKKECKIDKALNHAGEKGKEEIEDLTSPTQSAFIQSLTLNADTLNMDDALAEILTKMEGDPKWRDAIRCYKMAREGRPQREIALMMFADASKQTMVSRFVRSSGAEAKRRLGAIYEKATEIRLNKSGYKAVRDGRNGRPDIIATKDGRDLIASCKIYDDAKKLVSIEARQFDPEINECRVKGLDKFVLFFYNLAWSAEIIREMDKDLTTATLRRSEAVKPSLLGDELGKSTPLTVV